MTITIGHDSGPPKRIKRPRQRWNLGADMVGDTFENHSFRVVSNPDKWDLRLLASVLRCQKALRKSQLFQAELDLKKGPAHLLDIGWMQRNWARL